jgi:hypothetical protein
MTFIIFEYISNHLFSFFFKLSSTSFLISSKDFIVFLILIVFIRVSIPNGFPPASSFLGFFCDPEAKILPTSSKVSLYCIIHF